MLVTEIITINDGKNEKLNELKLGNIYQIIV